MSELRGLIKQTDPDVIGLGEASRIGKRSESIKGYDAFWLPEDYNGAGDTLVLVKHGVNLRKWNWHHFTKWWKGPKHGWPQGPKNFWNGRIKDDRLGVVRLSIGHWPFNTALPEVEAWCVDWFKKPLVKFKRKSVHLGDVNMQEPETTRFCKQFGGKNVGHRLDRAMFENCHVRARALGLHGSDHEAVLFTITN